ncbi:MAG: hypothetical protein IPO73_01715 [Gemmatimonadetes bacterium]|nr:hypothetical protein [Gemmatimonadota bacterium]
MAPTATKYTSKSSRLFTVVSGCPTVRNAASAMLTQLTSSRLVARPSQGR